MSIMNATRIRMQPPQQTSTCPLCCEENLSASGVILSACQHRSCKSCLTKWIEREEASGQATPPTCPFCRATVAKKDIFKILGRPFKPRGAHTNAPNGNGDEVDELTLHWINDYTVPCRGCGSRIEKESGCDLIECLCGYRFCYGCGVAGGMCGCNPNHDFLDDHDYLADALVRDDAGRVDLRSCILRRKVRADRQKERGEELYAEQERWAYMEEKVAICTSNGRWMFSSVKSAGCIAMLANQLRGELIFNKEAHKSRSRDIDIDQPCDNSWLFLRRGAEIRAMKQLLDRDDVRWSRLYQEKKKSTRGQASPHERRGF
eukprot:299830_1